MQDEDPVKKFVALVPYQVKKEGATQLVIAPAKIRPAVVAELGRLANLPEGPFPKEGLIDTLLAGVQTKWRLKANSPTAEWVLTPN